MNVHAKAVIGAAALILLGNAPVTVTPHHGLEVKFGDLSADSVPYTVSAKDGHSEAGEIHCVMVDKEYNKTRAGGHWDKLPYSGTIKFQASTEPTAVRCKLTARRADKAEPAK